MEYCDECTKLGRQVEAKVVIHHRGRPNGHLCLEHFQQQEKMGKEI